MVVGEHDPVPRVGLHSIGHGVSSQLAAGRMDLVKVRLVADGQFRLIGGDKKHIPGIGRMDADTSEDAFQSFLQGGGQKIPARTEIDKAVYDQRSTRLEPKTHRTERLPRHQVDRR